MAAIAEAAAGSGQDPFAAGFVRTCSVARKCHLLAVAAAAHFGRTALYSAAEAGSESGQRTLSL